MWCPAKTRPSFALDGKICLVLGCNAGAVRRIPLIARLYVLFVLASQINDM